MVKWKLKSCPKCNGDIFIEKDMHGWFEQCLQCGYVHNIGKTTDSEEQETWIEKERQTTTLITR